MSDALPLPPRPNLEQYKKLAKDFQHACKSGDPGAIRDWAARWVETIARLQGLEITPEVQRQIDGEAERIEYRWRKFKETNERAGRCALADAQFFIARGHGFANWPKFARHIEALARANSPVSTFEAAVDAIVSGDLAMLEKLLSENPELVRARSTREHRSTLLHYVSANGVEDFRQKTPKNILEITKLLLERGADVNAESDAYGGRSTTLGLTATSWHPENAGVQLPLMELLIDHGAIIDGPDGGSAVNGCLHNGRGEAAEFFASRGARLDLEGAAGVGQLDVVKSFFKNDGSLKSPATLEQMRDGFAWACEFGRTSVVEFLLQLGSEVDAKLKHNGQTGLHWAAYGGHVDTVKLLLQHGAPVDAKDDTYGGTPLGWALYAWGAPENAKRADYYEVVALLVRAGAKLDPEWYEENEDRRRAAEKMRADPRMLAALRGEMPR
ncbi:MAG: ankyrin repeat domain-containing protein [Acidobacteria bacterium]|nr:ankyrin repeat domain-containing protein [Acidobacteriota bacterium]